MTLQEDQEQTAAGGAPQGKKPITGKFWTLPRKTPAKTTPPNFDHECPTDAVTASKTFTSKKTMDPSHSARGQGDNVTGTYGATAKGSATDSGVEVTGKYNEENVDEITGGGPNLDASQTIPITPDSMKAISARKVMDPKHTGRAGTDETGRENGPQGSQKWSSKNTMDVAHSKRPADADHTEETEPEIQNDDETLITELEAAEREEYNKMIRNQLDLVVRSAMNDQPDEFSTAFNTVLNAYLQSKIAERKEQIQSAFLGTSTPSGGIEVPATKEETNGEEPTTDTSGQT